ncbi:hypothetical protein K503DRAFT_834452 [Rhizopogon vinicolor AM-OR11-026]|uniref:Uncharacterized protein n=1 Tax=Rhizopogon vinicolor AM-OR11-026 TaxID=1314800 RepID=A0A1B7MNV9_9AGAM|nr:hypothetical protein K503DRAFT_834452 [Rhizopogon vinicolor AM-OR11-026]
MSFGFPGWSTALTPGTVSYSAPHPSLRIPDTTSRRTGNPQPLHRQDIPSNDSNPLLQLRRRPSFSSTIQTVLPSTPHHRSRAVSTTTRIQHQTTSATPRPLPSPRVNESGISPSCGRSRTVSSGPSMRPSVPNTHFSPTKFPTAARPQNATVAPSSSQDVKSGPTPGNQTSQHQNTQSAAVIQQHPMLHDIALVAAVTAARTDKKEFLWYPVWVIAVKDWLFANSNTDTVACNIAPQYVLEHWYRNGPRAKVKKFSRIPDFAQVLQHVKILSNRTRVLGRQKVIMMVENKPTFPRSRWLSGQNPFQHIDKQIQEQAIFAFMGDRSLLVIGIIVAFGSRWRYVEFARPRTAYIKKCMDWEVGDRSNKRSNRPVIQEVLPEELNRLSLMGDGSFELLDHMGLSAQAFGIIARRVKSRERDMWNL